MGSVNFRTYELELESKYCHKRMCPVIIFDYWHKQNFINISDELLIFKFLSPTYIINILMRLVQSINIPTFASSKVTLTTLLSCINATHVRCKSIPLNLRIQICFSLVCKCVKTTNALKVHISTDEVAYRVAKIFNHFFSVVFYSHFI